MLTTLDVEGAGVIQPVQLVVAAGLGLPGVGKAGPSGLHQSTRRLEVVACQPVEVPAETCEDGGEDSLVPGILGLGGEAPLHPCTLSPLGLGPGARGHSPCTRPCAACSMLTKSCSTGTSCTCSRIPKPVSTMIW